MIKCSRCDKDITTHVYKVQYVNAILCWLCYRKIPVKERIKAIKGMAKK